MRIPVRVYTEPVRLGYPEDRLRGLLHRRIGMDGLHLYFM